MAVKRRAGEDDATFGARCYREQLLREINMHTGAGPHTQRAPWWIRRARAAWLYERASGVTTPGDWDIKRIVGALVALAYPEATEEVKHG